MATPASSSGTRQPVQDRPARLRGHGPIAPGSAPSGHAPSPDRELALPHERDESPGTASTGQAGAGAAGQRQQRVLRQAAEDLAAGQVDTDLHATPGLDAEQRDALLTPEKAPSRRRRR